MSVLRRARSAMSGRMSQRTVDRLVLGLPFAWLLLFFLAPFLFVVKISFAEIALAVPPFRPWFEWADGRLSAVTVTLENFKFVLQDRLYLYTFLNSVRVAAFSTLLVLLLGYPMAYAIARAPKRAQGFLLLLIIIPFWTSFLLRVYALMGLLSTQGLINRWLQALGIVDAPIEMLYTDFAVYLGIVYSYLPLMILPLYATLEKLDGSLLYAASDLGAGPLRRFIDITLPLSLPGVIAGCMLVFIPAMGEFVIPAMLGGADNPMIGRVLFEEFFLAEDWPVASALAVLLLGLLLLPIAILRHFQNKEADAS